MNQQTTLNTKETSFETQTKSPLQVLKETSRTFFIPIMKLSNGVQEAVASAYLCLRAIDEIEDHPAIPNSIKAILLRDLSFVLSTFNSSSTAQSLTPNYILHQHHHQPTLASQEANENSIDVKNDFQKYSSLLPEVSQRIGEWIMYCPATIRGRIVDATSGMADRMATWAERNWKCETVRDLDAYTFAVAGAVGVLLCDIWAWHDGTITDRNLAIGFGRGLQSVNILRNRDEDASRGVSFYPLGWTIEDMQAYAEKNLATATQYVKNLKPGSPAIMFCRIPYNLAVATCNALKNGRQKLTRPEVIEICERNSFLVQNELNQKETQKERLSCVSSS